MLSISCFHGTRTEWLATEIGQSVRGFARSDRRLKEARAATLRGRQ